MTAARAPALSLMIGNFVVGVCVLAPAGMLNELGAPGAIAGSIADAGLLVTYGAIVLCIGSPTMSWATSRLDRRTLMSGILFVLAAGHVASALAPSYAALLVIRLLMMAAAACYTPQAASTVALLVPAAERASAISFVFLGWSLSVAAGLPLIKLLAAYAGWRAGFAMLAGAAALAFVLHAMWLPRGLRGAAVSLESWLAIARHRQIRLILAVTVVGVAGQFAVFSYLAPLLTRLLGAGPGTIGAFFAIIGVTGFVGNAVATRIVGGIGALRTSFLFLFSVFLGTALWAFGAGSIVVMGAGAAFWGLGFAAMNSMQQARLVAAAPPLAAGSVALNTSAIYVGQAIGSATGGQLLANNLPLVVGYVSAACVLASLILLAFTRGPSESY